MRDLRTELNQQREALRRNEESRRKGESVPPKPAAPTSSFRIADDPALMAALERDRAKVREWLRAEREGDDGGRS